MPFNLTPFRLLNQILATAIENLPNPVPWRDVIQPESFDERRALIEPRTVNIEGVVAAGVEFCPNDDPPSTTETLVFLWLIRPDLSPLILMDIDEPSVREVIVEFLSRVSP